MPTCRCFTSLLKIVKYSPNISRGLQTCVNVQKGKEIPQWINDHMKLFFFLLFMLWLSGFEQQKENAMQASLISPLQETRWHWEHFPQCSFNNSANSPTTEEDDSQNRQVTWLSLDLPGFFVSLHHICGELRACKCAPWYREIWCCFWAWGVWKQCKPRGQNSYEGFFSSLVVKESGYQTCHFCTNGTKDPRTPGTEHRNSYISALLAMISDYAWGLRTAWLFRNKSIHHNQCIYLSLNGSVNG